jgi:hypothetical protein
VEGGSTTQQGVWASVLVTAVAWTLISAIGAALSARAEASGSAWGWIVSFVLSSVVAAYAFWRLP